MSWIKEPIKNLFNIEKGSLQSSKNVPGEYDFITAAADWKTNQAYDHECEALVFACAASGSLGRTHYVNGKFIASDLCFILTPKEGKKINMKFYHIYFNSIRKDIVKKTATGSAKLAINRKNFENYEIVYGDIDDQNKAQTLFGKYLPFQNELSVNVDESKELVNKLRQSILQDAIQGKLIQQYDNDEPASELLRKIKEEKEKLIKEKKIKKEKPLNQITDEEKIFDVPCNWEWVRLGEISKPLNDGVHYAPEYLNQGIPCFSAKDIYNDKINLDKCNYISEEEYNSMKDKISIETNSLLVTKSGTIGRSAIVDNYFVFGLVESIGVVNLLMVLPQYIKIILDYGFVYSNLFFDKYTNGIGVKHLTLTLLSKIVIPIPPLEEQKRIVAKLDKLMKLCDELEEKINSTGEEGEKLVDSVLQNIFRDS